MNQLLAASQCWGCGVAKDDVTEKYHMSASESLPALIILGHLYFRNNKTHTRMHTQRFPLLKGFVLKHSSVWRTHNPRMNTPPHTDACLSAEHLSSCEALIFPTIRRYLACYRLSAGHLCVDIDWMVLIFSATFLSKHLEPLTAGASNICIHYSFFNLLCNI